MAWSVFPSAAEVCAVGRQKPRWKPRGGQPLSTERVPGRVQEYVATVLGRVPQILLHPVWGIMVATLITISGRGELLLKSVGILLAALWLIGDMWYRLIPTNNQWRIILGWAATNALLIAVMGLMWWWLDSKLRDELADVYSNLQATIALPPNQDVFHSIATVKNGGGTDIDWHQTSCTATLIVFDDNAAIKGAKIQELQPHMLQLKVEAMERA